MARNSRMRTKRNNRKRGNKISRRRRTHSHKNKLWMQKGCSKKKCSKCHRAMTGGKKCNCNLFSGGGHGLPPVAGPTVGAPWGANVNQWPGVAGIDGQTNYLKLNNYDYDVQTQGIIQEGSQITIGGGKRRKKGGGKCNINPYDVNPTIPNGSNATYYGGKKRKHTKKGGRKGKTRTKKGGFSIIPQDLVNMGRTFTYGIGSAYNSLNGYPQPVNPLPFKDQLPNTLKANQINALRV